MGPGTRKIPQFFDCPGGQRIFLALLGNPGLTGLREPVTNSITAIRAGVNEPQNSGFFGSVRPDYVGVELDPLFGMWGDKDSIGAQLMNRISRLERQALFGGIEHNSATSRLKLEVGNSPRPLPWSTPSFGFHGLFMTAVSTALELLFFAVFRSTSQIPVEPPADGKSLKFR